MEINETLAELLGNETDIKQIGNTKDSDTTIRFVYTFLQDINTMSRGYQFGLNFPIVERMRPMAIKVGNKVRIIERGESVSLGFGTGEDAIVADSNTREVIINGEKQYMPANVTLEKRLPDQIIAELMQAYGEQGLFELTAMKCSIVNNDLSEVRRMLELYNIVMGGLPQGTILQDMPDYFDFAQFQFPNKTFENTASMLIQQSFEDGLISESEVGICQAILQNLNAGLSRAFDVAVHEAQGILAKTKASREAFKQGDRREKANYDNLDRWLIGQFPLFPMDEGVESMRQAVNATLQNNYAPPMLQPAQTAPVSDERLSSILDVVEQMQAEREADKQRIAELEAQFNQTANVAPVDNVQTTAQYGMFEGQQVEIIGKGFAGQTKVRFADGTEKQVKLDK